MIRKMRSTSPGSLSRAAPAHSPCTERCLGCRLTGYSGFVSLLTLSGETRLNPRDLLSGPFQSAILHVQFLLKCLISDDLLGRCPKSRSIGRFLTHPDIEDSSATPKAETTGRAVGAPSVYGPTVKRTVSRAGGSRGTCARFARTAITVCSPAPSPWSRNSV